MVSVPVCKGEVLGDHVMAEEPFTIEIEVRWKKARTTFQTTKPTMKEANNLIKRYRESLIEPVRFRADVYGRGQHSVQIY